MPAELDGNIITDIICSSSKNKVRLISEIHIYVDNSGCIRSELIFSVIKEDGKFSTSDIGLALKEYNRLL